MLGILDNSFCVAGFEIGELTTGCVARSPEVHSAAHCPLATVPTSVWYDQCRMQFVGV